METQETSELIFFVNGVKVVEKNAEPETTLLQYLRNQLRLTGTKLGCGEGGCGACTVMVSKYDHSNKQIHHYSINACIAPLCSMHGLAVTTVEGIGSVKNGLHPVQERLAKSHGTQCGFCTPGIVMSMYTLLRNNPRPSACSVEKAVEGNLCRCTGYRPILDGFRTFTKDVCGMGENCCRNGDNTTNHLQNGVETEIDDDPNEFLPLDPSQDPIFPPELQKSPHLENQSLVFYGERVVWYRPTSLQELLKLKSKYPDAKLVNGNTEVGLEVKLKNLFYPVIIAPMHVNELKCIENTTGGIKFGASVTLTRLEEELRSVIEKYPEYQTRMFAAVVEMLTWFAGSQIRNVAALGGNIVTASPVSDLNPVLLAAGAILEVHSSAMGRRLIKMDEKFFLSYRKTAIKADEILISILFPFTSEDEYVCSYKQAHRREDDIAIVNAGIRVLFEDNSNVIKEVAFAYGGMAPVTAMATKTMKAIEGMRWEDDLVPEVCRLLADDLPLVPGSPGGMVEYRRTLASSFFFKCYLTVLMNLQTRGVNTKSKVPPSFERATLPYRREPSRSRQVYEEVPTGQSVDDSVGRPLPHMSGMKQITGEAEYIDDIPEFSNELHIAFVHSERAHANILAVDVSKALTMPGVRDYICYKDVPGSNLWGVDVADEEAFASKKVLCQGQIIGGIVAETRVQAQRAAKCVKVEYEELQPIITIKDAIKAGSFYPFDKSIHCGDVDNEFRTAEHVVEGELHIGGQEHFYLETQTAIAVPKDVEEMELYVSTQNPSGTQAFVAKALGVPASRVAVRVKRIGGGFGGKDTRNSAYTIPVAVAAKKLGCPVRVSLERDEDMISSGCRHPFFAKYKVGFTDTGKMTALDIELYNNAGMSSDVSSYIMIKSLFQCDNAYKVPNLRIKGHLCKTNIPSNTAFRGFGAPQAMLTIEHCIMDISVTLGIPPIKVRENNFYCEGDTTHYKQALENCNLQRCWKECMNLSDFHRRKREVDIFNSENRWKKRGIALIPTKYSIAFEVPFMNQAGALVHVYHSDGSVLLTHGGVEMGQGLHTKMIQVASRALGIPASKIYISETGTKMVPNTLPTAGSMSSDLNGMAVVNACQKLLDRLAPIMKENPKGTWEEWVNDAYFQRISLSAAGFYKLPGLSNFDFKTNTGKPFNYYSYGAACSEVEIDCLTGDHKVLRTDIVMDVGTSLNPAVDIGQIEGGFMQGYGLFMMEQQKVSPKGFQFTRGPSGYKIPGFGDIPIEFNVSLLKGSANKRAVYSSKAIGEPPLFLGSSVFFAVKEAILSARKETGNSGKFRLDSPATPERVRMACEDEFTDMFPQPEEGTYTPWFVVL